jgi:hypothetical protein
MVHLVKPQDTDEEFVVLILVNTSIYEPCVAQSQHFFGGVVNSALCKVPQMWH